MIYQILCTENFNLAKMLYPIPKEYDLLQFKVLSWSQM